MFVRPCAEVPPPQFEVHPQRINLGLWAPLFQRKGPTDGPSQMHLAPEADQSPATNAFAILILFWTSRIELNRRFRWLAAR